MHSRRVRPVAAATAAVEAQMMAVGGEGRFVQEWGFFLKCYAEGRFNMSNPPDPPPRRGGWGYLTAPVPAGEKERLEVCYFFVCWWGRRVRRRRQRGGRESGGGCGGGGGGGGGCQLFLFYIGKCVLIMTILGG